MTTFAEALLGVVLESAPYLLLGFVLAGLTKVWLGDTGFLGRALGRPGPRSVGLAAVVGAPLPLCSCSVLPAALALRRQGASKGATSSFLVSVPETDFVSVSLTYGLLGPVFAIARPLAALVTAFSTGVLVDAVDRDDAPSSSRTEPDRGSRSDVATADACCSGDDERCEGEDATASAPRPWWRRALHFGFVEFFDDVNGPLALGLVVAALVAAVAPSLDTMRLVSHPVIGYALALLIGVPTYVCATASTPVAAGLLAGGMSPGAVLVFLLAGPATNAGSLVVLGRELGRRSLLVYLGTVSVVALVSGLAVDALFDARSLTVAPLHAVEDAHGPLAWAAGGLFVVLVVRSAVRTRLLGRTLARIRRLVGR